MASTPAPASPPAPIPLIFQQRSGRVIALSRMLLASFFTLAFALDPTQSETWVEPALLLLSAYTLISGVIFFATRNNWWLDARLATPTHVLDMIIFAVLVFLTEGYVSPFFTFFVFLVLSSTIRGGYREAALTTAIVVALFLAASLLATGEGPDGLNIRRFVVRGAHVTVLSFMIVWFGMSQFGARQRRVAMELDESSEEHGPPVHQALRHAAARLNAQRLVLAWSEREEPWLYVDAFDGGATTRNKFGPDDFAPIVDPALAEQPMLFDVAHRHVLTLAGGRADAIGGEPVLDPVFSERFALDAGLAIPIRTGAHDGHLFAVGIPGMSGDDLRVAATVGDEIAAAFERGVLFATTRDAAATRVRLALARDLHDSVVQFLAGMGLQLEGLKKNAGALPPGEIDVLQQQLVAEQRDLRRLIGTWRDPDQSHDRQALADRLRTVVSRLEQQWGIAIALDMGSLSAVPVRLHHEIEQLVREGIANAARHGHASNVAIAIATADRAVMLAIGDNGAGFPISGSFADAELRHGRIGPRSLTERVHLLNGNVRLTSGAQAGSQLAITLPW